MDGFLYGNSIKFLGISPSCLAVTDGEIIDKIIVVNTLIEAAVIIVYFNFQMIDNFFL